MAARDDSVLPAAADRIRRLQAGRWLAAAILLAVAWWIILATLAYITANPVTLNREQILHAAVVVQGAVEDLETGRVRVERQWKASRGLETITVVDLRKAGPRELCEYVFPLEATADNRFRITASPLPGNPPLIYPAGDEAVRQLEDILRSVAQKSGRVNSIGNPPESSE